MTVCAMAADRIQRKTARTMSLHRICLVDKIADRGQKLRFARASAYTFFELCVQNYVDTQLEVLTIKIYIYILYII